VTAPPLSQPVALAARVPARTWLLLMAATVVVQVLEGENAVAKNRELMGATDPKKADKGTIRADLASSIEENVVHGSDSAENARNEIAYFFATSDVLARTR